MIYQDSLEAFSDTPLYLSELSELIMYFLYSLVSKDVFVDLLFISEARRQNQGWQAQEQNRKEGEQWTKGG